MAATRNPIPRTTLLHAALAALVTAGCAVTPPAGTPEPEQAEDRIEVGYGTLPARNVTSAVTRLETNRPGDVRVARVEELIQGRVAGVQVLRTANGGYSVRIRGTATMMGDGEPLYVVDGTPLSSGMPGQALIGINPSDIANIVVLKDAAASSIYGSQAANGVILITTRRN